MSTNARNSGSNGDCRVGGDTVAESAAVGNLAKEEATVKDGIDGENDRKVDVKNSDSKTVGVTCAKVKEDEVTNAEVKMDDVTNSDVSNAEVKKDNVTNTEVRKDDVTKAKVSKDYVTNAKVNSDDVIDTKDKKDDVTNAKVNSDDVIDTKGKKDDVTNAKVSKDDVTNAKVNSDDVTDTKDKTDDVTGASSYNCEADTSAEDEEEGRPARPQPNLRRRPAEPGQPGKSARFRQLEAAWPGEFCQRMAVPYSEYDSHSQLGKISWSEYALVEKEDTVRRGHHAVCPLIRSRKTGTLYRCKIVSSSRVHFNLTTLGFKPSEFEREIRNSLVERQLLFAFDCRHPFVRSGLGYFTDACCNFGVFLEEFPHGTLLDYYHKSDSNRIVCHFDEAAVRMMAAQVVLALEYLHCVGCVHRDVQAANLLVDRRGYLRLTDFAITAAAEPDALRPLQAVTCFRYYAAPEYFNGKGYGYPVDFYALGLVLYELLTCECFCDQEEVFDADGQVDWGTTLLPEAEHRRRLAQQMLDAQAIQGQAQSSSAAKLAAAAAPAQTVRPTPCPEARAFVEDCLLCEPDCRPDRRTARLYDWFASVDFDRLYDRQLDLPWQPPANTAVSYQPDVDEEYPIVGGALLDQKPLPAEFEPYKHLF